MRTFSIIFLRLIMDEYSNGHLTSLLFKNRTQTFITLKEIQSNTNTEYINFYLDCFDNPEHFCLIKKYHVMLRGLIFIFELFKAG